MDTPALLDVFFRSVEDLDDRRGRPRQPRNPGPLEQHFQHLIRTDPGSAFAAVDGGRIVAFGIGMVRGSTWFLSFLFVAPEWQGRGLGRALLDACLRESTATVAVRATCAEADQPVSTGLYASVGIAPRLPIYLLRGAMDGRSLPALPDGVRAMPLASTAAALDRALLGHERPADHAFWADTERRGWSYVSASGDALAYGYAHRSGRIGPVASADAALLPAIMGHLSRSTQVHDGFQVIVPGPAFETLQPLLHAGLRIDGSPAVYCADGAPPPFDRYLLGSYALP